MGYLFLLLLFFEVGYFLLFSLELVLWDFFIWWIVIINVIIKLKKVIFILFLINFII